MDVKLLTILLLLFLVCVTDQRRVRHDRGRNGLRRYGSGRHHKGLGRHQGQGRRLSAAKRRKLMRMLPYEAEEDVKVRERMNVSLWKLGVRSEERPQSRPKRDVTRVVTLPLNPKLTLVNGESGTEYSLQRKEIVQKKGNHRTPWPLPRHLLTNPNQIYKIYPHDFHFTISESLSSCSTLTGALKRYFTYITGAPATDWSVKIRSDQYPRDDPFTLDHVDIRLDSCSDTYPGEGMDEAYNIQIAEGAASISSKQVWGTLRGLETLAQLVRTDSSTGELLIPGAKVTDSPKYPYRGVVINTSKHFLPIDSIRGILRRMEQNKLNSLHWVLSVGQALNMNQNVNGSDQTYSSKDVKVIVDYAKERGILVIPEVNTLGYVYTGLQYLPDIVDCTHGNKAGILDISKNLTYSFIRTALGNILTAFPQSPILLGSSLPDARCWKQSLKIKRFMSEMGIKDFHDLVVFHTQSVVKIIHEVDATRTILVYNSNGTARTCADSSLVKFRKLESVSLGDGEEFSAYHWCQRSLSRDPVKGHTSKGGPTLRSSNLVGGELDIWGEDVNSTSGLTEYWFPMTTVAGTLWGDLNGGEMTKTRVRVQEHFCSMIRRESLFSSVNIPDSCRLHTP